MRLRLLLFIPIILITLMLNTSNLSCSPNASNAIEHINEPGIIDVHAHIGEFKGFDLSLNSLLATMSESNIEYAFISNIDGAAISGVTADGDETTVNEKTAKISSENPKLKPLFWAKPGAKGASAEIAEKFLRDKKFYGIKFHPDFNNFQANSASVIPYLALCQKYNVPALFHCGGSPRSSAKVIYEVAKKFPNVPFVLYHMGFNTSHEEAINVAQEAKNKKDALIYLEISHVPVQEILKAIKTVGADRVIFGTDATYYGRNHYDTYLGPLKTIKGAISATEFQQFIHNNAVEIFHLPSSTPSQGNQQKNEPSTGKSEDKTRKN
ncbi:MAG: amidohydrolase family protein [Acidobacteria bacterium]|nr:amidohydrolase family protein [Acidobacteriota bacterium]